MRKIISLVLILVTILTFSGCGNKKEVKIITPNGTPFIAVGNLIGEDKLTIDNVSGSEPLTTALSTGSYDIVLAPVTLGTKLYLKGISKYKLDSVVTVNNTYIVSRKTTTLTSITDLAGKTITAYGKNNTPDIALKAALGTQTTTINYVDSVQTAVSQFIGNTTDPSNPPANTPEYILIAEPSLTQLKETYNMELNILDLSKVMNTKIYQAGIFVNPDSDAKSVEKVINKIKTNINNLNENPAEYANAIVSKNRVFEALTANVIEKSIPYSNIEFIKAKEDKTGLNAYFTLVNNYNAGILGGTPNEDFFN